MYLLGLDIGSSFIKVSIVDASNLNCLSNAKYPDQEMKIDSPQPSWAEQHPDVWWTNTQKAIHAAIVSANINSSDITAIGISYQMHGLVCVDKNGTPLRPAIIWCDSRSIEAGNDLAKNLDESYIKNHLLNLPGNFTASKLSWLKTHEPDVYHKIHKIMLPGDYIAYKMTGEFTTTYSGMSEGIFWDFPHHMLSDEVLNAGGFNKNIFPKIGGCFEIISETNVEFEKSLGIKKGTPISYRSGDQPNNAYSLGVLNPGEAAFTAGTSGVIYSVSKDVVFDPLSRVNTFAHVNHSEQHHSLGTLLCINGVGILYNWLRTNLYQNTSYDDLEKIAATCDVGSDGLITLPFGNGAERMLGNRKIGASLHNLDFNRHTKAHLIRSGLEGLACAFNYGIEIMKELGINIKTVKVGNDNLFQSHIFCNTLAAMANIEIEICDVAGATGAARGAANTGSSQYDPPLSAKAQFIAPLVQTQFIASHLQAQFIASHIQAQGIAPLYNLWKSHLQQK